ncbi:MAG TPA: ubiquitin-like domain-containing protein, partial [Clostridiales bacterium]|nr:ubiquitin-like domain-containing protein [Clostridiales bacterium]
MNQQLQKAVAAVAAHKRPIVITAFLLSFAIAFTTVATASSPVIRQIKIFDSGSTLTVQSISADPAAVLAAAGIETGERDLVDVSHFADDEEPSIIVYRYCSVFINDDGAVKQIGAAGFVADALEAAGVVLAKGDVVSRPLNEPLAPGMEIAVARA